MTSSDMLIWHALQVGLTVLLVPLGMCAIKRYLSVKDQSDMQRHDALQKKLEDYCLNNSREHDHLWARVNTHSHQAECKKEECRPQIGRIVISEHEVGA